MDHGAHKRIQTTDSLALATDFVRVPEADADGVWAWVCPNCGTQHEQMGAPTAKAGHTETCAYCGTRAVLSGPRLDAFEAERLHTDPAPTA